MAQLRYICNPMNKSALLGILLAVLLPLLGYFLVDHYGKTALHMPPRYFYDSVVTIEKRGKYVTDTLWHSVSNTSFINQLGNQVSIQDIKSKATVVNFFFTRCPSVCPGLTKSMMNLQHAYRDNPELVQFLSISVDPVHDSVPNLRKYADRFGVNHDNWWMVSGNKDSIYNFSLKEMKASIADTEVDSTFIHTENFFLLDSNYVVRGWYNGFDTLKMAQLAKDIATLHLEKGKNSPSVFRRFIPVLPLIFIGIALVFIVLNVIKRKKL